MVGDKEARAWLILMLGLLWATLAWVLYDQLTWAPGGSPEEAVHQLYRKTVLLFWGLMVVMGFGALALTRFAYSVLRAPRNSSEAVNG